MISTDYSVYVKNAINITRSLIIKQDVSALTMNRFLKELGDTIPESPYDWKYYLNLAGIKYDNDNIYTANEDIVVKSLDTNINIVLTPEILVYHPITYNELRLKGLLYKKLLAKYPYEEFYINGILNPMDLSTTVEAKDFTILYYDKNLVEENEVNLIPQIQEWIYNFKTRWFNAGYCITDKLYPFVFVGTILSNIVPLILNIRLNNCKTNMAHSYHIWNYLGGYFELDKYRDVISRPQAMFLYLNLDYIFKHNGTQKNLKLLNDWLLKPSKLELKKYILINDVKVLYSQLVEDYNVSVVSDIFAIKTQLDEESNEVNIDEMVTLRDMIIALNPLGSLNTTDVENQKNLVDEKSLQTIYTNIPTGILEVSNIPDPSNFLVDILYEKVIQWFYLANEGYIVFNYILNDIPGISKPISLSAKEAIVMLVAIDKLLKVEDLEDIDTITIYGALDESILTDEEILNLIEEKYYKQNIYISSGEHISFNKFEYIKKSLVLPENIFTVDDYINYSQRLINVRIQHKLLIGSEPESFGKSQLKSVLDCFNKTVELDLTNYTTYSQFFTHFDLDPYSLTEKTLKEMMVSIVVNFLGIGKDVIQTENLVKGITEILKSLTSYSLQYTYKVNDSRVNIFDWPMLSITDLTNTLDPDYIDFLLERKSGINTLEIFDKFTDVLDVEINSDKILYMTDDDIFEGILSGGCNILCQLEESSSSNVINAKSLSGE